jgi:ABC-type arginine transport system permease subunit
MHVSNCVRVCIYIYMCIVRIFNEIMIVICVFLTLPYVLQHTHTHTHIRHYRFTLQVYGR